MKAFDYIRPQSLKEASEHLSNSAHVKIMGGGATLLLQLQNEGLQPDILLDVKGLPGMEDVRYHHNHGLKLGAAVKVQHLASGLEIRRHYPLLHQTAAKMASPQIRNRATIGGTTAWASPISELAASLLCYDASCHTWRPQGTRTIAISEMYLGNDETALEPDEIITHITLPSFPARTFGVYDRHTVRHDGRQMIAGAAALAVFRHNTLTHWRIAVLGVDTYPKRIPEAEILLEGAPAEADIMQALEAVQDAIHPQDVPYARADYRRAVLNTLLNRHIHDILQNFHGSIP